MSGVATGPVLEADMTEEPEQILQAVLRNQEVIMNALAELLNTGPEEMPRGLRRGRMIADLESYGTSKDRDHS